MSIYTFDTLWELSRFPDIEELMREHCDETVQTLGLEVIKTFHETVEPEFNSFQKGLIHGDLNDCNILVKPSSDITGESKYDISGLIDYGDICYSYYIYEIATLMADLMASIKSEELGPLEIGKLVLSGYRQEFKLQKNELDCLRTVICARLLQYYVLSAVSLKKNPGNQYAGLCRDEYHALAMMLWKIDESEFRQAVVV